MLLGRVREEEKFLEKDACDDLCETEIFEDHLDRKDAVADRNLNQVLSYVFLLSIERLFLTQRQVAAILKLKELEFHVLILDSYSHFMNSLDPTDKVFYISTLFSLS